MYMRQKKEQLALRVLHMLKDRVQIVEEQVNAGNYAYAHSSGICAQQQLEYLVALLEHNGTYKENLE